MGRVLNDQVAVNLDKEIAGELNLALGLRKLQPFTAGNSKFVFCAARGDDEPCMAFALIADSRTQAAAFLDAAPEMSNLKALFLLSQGNQLPPQTPPVDASNLRSCCSLNRNTPAVYVTTPHEGGTPQSVTILNRMLEATFDPSIADEKQRGMQELIIRPLEKSDVKCGC